MLVWVCMSWQGFLIHENVFQKPENTRNANSFPTTILQSWYFKVAIYLYLCFLNYLVRNSSTRHPNYATQNAYYISVSAAFMELRLNQPCFIHKCFRYRRKFHRHLLISFLYAKSRFVLFTVTFCTEIMDSFNMCLTCLNIKNI